MAPPGGIEPHAVHPILRIGLEDRYRARWFINLFIRIKSYTLSVSPQSDITLILLENLHASNVFASEVYLVGYQALRKQNSHHQFLLMANRET